MPSPKLCRLHRAGVPPNAPPFYVPGCPRCEDKLDAGLVTEQTPPPPDRHLEHGRRIADAERAERGAPKKLRPGWRET